MSDHESKTLAEATNDELVAELQSRCSASAIGLSLHSEPGRFRAVVTGNVLESMSLSSLMFRHASAQGLEAVKKANG
jgi:hypothetical protein